MRGVRDSEVEITLLDVSGWVEDVRRKSPGAMKKNGRFILPQEIFTELQRKQVLTWGDLRSAILRGGVGFSPPVQAVLRQASKEIRL